VVFSSMVVMVVCWFRRGRTGGGGLAGEDCGWREHLLDTESVAI